MTRKELVGRIKRHEAKCSRCPNTAFGVAEVVELSDGILAVRETDGEHTLYYVKSKCQLRANSLFEDEGSKIRDFPSDTGFITNMMARDWSTIFDTAQMILEAPSRCKISWHKKPVPIKY